MRDGRVLDYPALGRGDTLCGLRNTIAHLRMLIARRAAVREHRAEHEGRHVAYTSDPAWCVNVAINRRAGWPDDPGHVFGSAMPVKRWKPGMVAPIWQFPKRGSGDQCVSGGLHPHTINMINTPRVRVYERDVPKRYRARLAHRLTSNDDF